MPLQRFEGAFHLSMLTSYISYCELATKFTYVMGIVPEFRSTKMVAGTMLHHALLLIHTRELLDAPEKTLEELIRECWRYAEFETRDFETPVWWDDEDKDATIESYAEDSLTMLKNYCKAPANRNCEVILNEAEFTLTIGKYNIEGRIDQLRKYDGLLELPDFKTGKGTIPSDIQLARDVQFNGYAIAVEQGTFRVDGKDVVIGQLPDVMTYYNLRDHLEYQKPTPIAKLEDRGNNLSGSYKDWFTDTAKTYTMEQIRLIMENNRLSAKNKLYFAPGHEKGPGRHSIELTERRSKVMGKAIQWACAAMRLNIYKPNSGACSSCRHIDTCNRYLDGTVKEDFMSDYQTRKAMKEFEEYENQ